MSQRLEFVHLAMQEGANISALCRQFGISRKTGYKWVQRQRCNSATGLADRSRRPHTSPTQTPPSIEALVLALRDQHPTWGGRKLYHRLVALGYAQVPQPSTITAILHRHDRLDPAHPSRQGPFQRFVYPQPNDLWQLDFMGHRALGTGRVHPLTLLDDHSRFALALVAGPDQRQALVRSVLTSCFQRYGLPQRILTDNGPPWGSSGRRGITALEAWLLRLGIDVLHGRPYHPQTQGKVERVHRTIATDVFQMARPATLTDCQQAFDAFRDTYNLLRPHEALGNRPPASCYQLSPRPYPVHLAPIEYSPDAVVRTVNADGVISVYGQRRFISRGLAGYPVAIRPTIEEHCLSVYFCHARIGTITLTDTSEV